MKNLVDYNDLDNAQRILVYIHENGKTNYTTLIKNKKINLSRNTISKYLKFLRENGLIEIEYEDKIKWNKLTIKGRLEVEKILGKDDYSSRVRRYKLIERQVKNIRDKFLLQFGSIPNSLLIDCVQNFLEIEDFDFIKFLETEEKAYIFAYYISRFNLKYSKSEQWRRVQPEIIKLLQKEFRNHFKINNIELEYFLKKWSEIRKIYFMRDKNGEPWFLMEDDMVFEALLMEIRFRTQRAVLQELIFENFHFQLSNEGYYIGVDLIKNFMLELDYNQIQILVEIINFFMRKFLEQDKGFSYAWKDIPIDKQSLIKMEKKLKSELKSISPNSNQALEIFRILNKIYLNLKKQDESILWGEKYLNHRPNDIDMLHSMQLVYFNLKKYQEFLQFTEKTLKIYKDDLITMRLLIEYYVDIDQDLKKAKLFIGGSLKIIKNNPNLIHLEPFFLYYRAKVFYIQNDFESAKEYSFYSWYEHQERNLKLFNLIVNILKKLENWEELEDFCLGAYNENEYDTNIIKELYFSLLKRKSYVKAKGIYEKVSIHYPELLPFLNELKSNLSTSTIKSDISTF